VGIQKPKSILSEFWLFFTSKVINDRNMKIPATVIIYRTMGDARNAKAKRHGTIAAGTTACLIIY